MTKSEAISCFRTNGFQVYGNIIFSSENDSYGRKFWANSREDFLYGDW